jgi:alpha-L-fucosidase
MQKLFYLGCLIFFLIVNADAQNLKGGGEAYPQLKTNKLSLINWRVRRFGLFVHWGPVSQKGTEIGWSRGGAIPFEEYDNLYKTFNPEHFDAAAWIRILKKAGMKYLVFVSKHHDGFVMWDTETTDYNIMSTPYHRDVMMELANECRRQGILFGTYYSICDWKHPDYPIENNNPQRKINANMDKYILYMKAQIKELVEKYHTKILWFDGEWEEPWTHEMGMELYKYVRSLDDEILINNRVDKGRHGMEGVSLSEKYAGDFATPEQQIGRYDTLTPWESCITICRQWAWKPDDIMKSREECLSTLVKTVGGDGNLLLNVGPMPDGRIEERQAERLREMGVWLDQFGESIYDTRGGPIPPQKWGVSTHKDDKIYLHILNPSKQIVLRDFSEDIKNIHSMKGDQDIPFTHNNDTVFINLPEIEPDQFNDVLIMELK